MSTRIATLTTAFLLVLPWVASAQNLVGHWIFNGNQNDSSGRNNQARRNGAATYASGPDGQALDLSGKSLTISNSPSLQTNQFTVDYSVYMNTAGNYVAVASKGSAWQSSIVAGVDSDGRAIGGQSLQFCLGGVCKTSFALSRSPVGRWMQIQFGYDGTTATGYADGAPVVTFDANTLPGNSTADIQLGNASGNSASDFNGLIRDLKIYDAALKPALVAQLSGGAVLGTTAITVGSAATSSSVVLAATGAWTATANNSFLHIAAGSASGTGNALVIFSVDAFTSTGSRSGTLTIAGLTLTVTQAGTNYATPGRLLVSNTGNASVAFGIAVDASGTLYLSTDNALQKVTFPGALVSNLATGIGPIAVSCCGDLYIADTGSAVLTKVNVATHQLTTMITGITVNGLAMGPDNNLYIADTGNGAIKQLNTTTGTVTTLVSGLNYVYGVAVDAAGNVYFTETDHYDVNKVPVIQFNVPFSEAPAGTDHGVIRKWSAATGQVTTVVSLNHPWGLAVDGSGNLYCMDMDYSAFNNAGDPYYNVALKWTAATGQLSPLAELLPGQWSIGAFRDRQIAVTSSGSVYFTASPYFVPTGAAVYEIPNVFVPSVALNEPLGSGTDALPPVLPVTTTDLTGVLAPVSDQSWLTIGSLAGGIVHFSFTAHPSAPSTAYINMGGIQSSVTQTVAVPNVAGQTQAAAITSITNGFLMGGNVYTGVSATVAVGSVIGTAPASGVQVPVASAVNLVISVGAATLATNAIQVSSAAASSTALLRAAGFWAASSNSVFLHIAQGSSSGTGSGLVAFTIDAFTGTGSRTGTLTIAGLTFTVTQQGTNFAPAVQVTSVSETRFSQPEGVAVDASGWYIADSGSDSVKKWNPSTQLVTTLESTSFDIPSGVALDSLGNVFIANPGDTCCSGVGNTIKKWTAATQQTTTLISAGLNRPSGVAVDNLDNLYIADTSNGVIKKWNPVTGVITTLVTGLNQPFGVAADPFGNIYIADTGNNAIKEWDVVTGLVTTLVGSGLNGPHGVAVDRYGNVYIGDTGNNALKKWTAATGQVTTVEAIGPYLFPYGLAIDASGSVYEAYTSSYDDKEGGIRVLTFGFVQTAAVPNVVGQTQAAGTSAITSSLLTVGAVTTALSSTVPIGSVISTSPPAGTVLNIGSAVNLVISTSSTQVPGVVGQTQAAATSTITGASLVVGSVTTGSSTTVPAGNVISQNPASGTLVPVNSAVSLVISSGSVAPDVIGQSLAAATSLITGAGMTVGNIITTVSPSLLNNPGNVISDLVGNVYIANAGNNSIEKWNAATGQLTTLVSGLNQPGGVGIDKAGNLYIADTGNNAIKKWDVVTNQVITLVSTGLNHPQGIVVDRNVAGPYSNLGHQQIQSNGDVYFSDTGNNAIKVWTAATQQVTTLISSGLNQPTGLGWCIGVGLYIADTGNNAIKHYYPSGEVDTTVSAGLNHPTAVVCTSYVDNATAFLNGISYPVLVDYIPYPDLYIADTGNNAIKYWPSGNQPQLKTIATGLNQPLGIASDGLDVIWVADTGNNRLQKLNCDVFGGEYCGGGLSRISSTLFRTVPPGTVFSTNPAAGTSVNLGSAVNLTIDGGLAALGSYSVLVGKGAGNSSVFLATQVSQVPWAATANDSFLHLAAGSNSGNGGAWLAFTIDAFSGTGVRTGTLTIAGLTFTVTQVGADYAATTQLSAPIGGGLNFPDAVAADGFGNLYIADTGNNSIKKWSPATQQMSTLISSGLTNPHAIAVDGFGNLYIGDATTLQKWTAATQQLMTLVSGLSAPSGINLDSLGNVYYTTGTSTVAKWTASTQAVTTLLSTGLTGVRGVTLDSSGNVFLADISPTANAIDELIAGAAPLKTVLTALNGLNGPWGITFDPSGDLYLSDSRNSAIKKWSAATGNVTTLVQGSPVGTTNLYRGIALDGSGNLYFAERSLHVIGQLSKAYVSAGSLSEPNTAGSGSLPPVIPIATDLTGTFAPVSDQTWLTIGTVANGVVNFSFAANGTGSSRTAHITVLGVQFTVSQASPVAVPDMVGQTSNAATTAITTAGLVLGTITTAPSSTVTAGIVISTNPAAATQVSLLSAVNLVVSTGPAQVAVPNVAGQTQIAATTAITGAGLVVGTVTTASSGTVAVGIVISTTPTAATQVNVGSAVNLVVSTGPAQVAVPNVVGQTQIGATTAITGAGLVLGSVTTASSGTVAVGGVISSNPAAATQVNLGSAVNLVISTGKIIPTITWPAPATIAFGSALGSGQLNATVNVPGVFSYNPPVGTALPAGNGQTLSVTFVPTDLVNYDVATGSTVINVNPAQPSPAKASLVVTSVLTRSGGNIVVVMTIANTGGTTAANVVLTTAKVGTTTGSPAPQNLGDVASGSIVHATVTVPGAAGATGAASTLAITGAYTGGTFSSSGRITLP